jgi:hypothetical protein
VCIFILFGLPNNDSILIYNLSALLIHSVNFGQYFRMWPINDALERP